MNELIDKSRKLTDLLIEYREAKIYETCLYHVVEQPDRKGWYFLFDIKTQQINRDGTPDKIKGWLRLRNIQPQTVYKYELLTQ